MLLRKTTWFWKSGLAAISFVLILSISGCSDAPPEENTVSETVIDVQAIQEESEEDADEIISVCIDLYEKAEEENKLADLETIRSIVNRLGENGYSAVDSRNQINMTEPEKVVEFCEKVDAQEEAEITILEISYLGGFVKYDLHTKGGNVDVVRSYYKYENGNMKREVIGNYQAEYWNYTEEGYLMFSGVWFSEELYVLTLSGAEEHTALRVQPLDETYRELSRKYLNPISFERNNMFIVDWSEEDFGDLNFYDMYDILYPKVNGQYAPYVADDNLSVSAVYQIPKEEFESVIMKYFNIDSETLQSKTIYDSENLTYEYKPRGFEEVEYPEYPYSEVVGFTENNDGTITLTANVVFPYAGDSKVYAHEVVVRPLENGRVQYVSNRIIPSEDNYRETWHGSCLIRIKPMTEEQCEMSERCVRGLGYQEQNLLCSNWNVENMSELDYNGMFEYLYGMKYGEKFNSEDYPNGIPKEEFESLIMEYLPITAEQIREYAVFDEENQTYLWARLGCFNYAPTFFGTSLPEVVDIKENQDGTVTLTVEAVCDMVICDDAVITHELTVRFAEDGSFQYLGNEILNDGIMHIPDYQYRIKE